MFYLMMHSTHFNMVILHQIKSHSDRERRNLLLPLHEIIFPITSKGSFMCTIQDKKYHSLCYTSHGALAGMSNRSMKD